MERAEQNPPERHQQWARAVRLSSWVLVGLALALLALRLGDALDALMGTNLNGDIYRFLDGAREMRWFYDSGFREPLHVAFIKLALACTDNAEHAVRALSALQTLFAAGMLYLFARRFFGHTLALVALYLFAINPIVAFYGVQGLRAPLYTGLLLAFALALYHPWPSPRARLGAVLTGLLAAALILTRVYAILIVVGAVMVFLLRARAWRAGSRRQALMFAALVCGLAALLALPMFVFRDWATVDHNINFLRNLERYGHAGDPEAEASVGLLQWIFGEHSLWQVFTIVLGNYLRYGYQYLPFFMRGYAALAWLFPVGLIAALASRRGHVVATLILALAPIVFVLHLDQVPGAKGVESRLVYQCFPFAVTLALFGLVWPLSQGLRWLARRDGAAAPWLRATAQALAPPAPVVDEDGGSVDKG